MIYARKAPVASGLLCGAVLYLLGVLPAHAIFINEIHYDNLGADSGEGVELSGEAGSDLAGWSLVFYNGSASSLSPYRTVALTGVFADAQNGMGILGFGVSGIQNGGPDGLALVDDLGAVIQFLSYEGSFTASSGVATGMTSDDIGVAESTSSPVGYSLQLTGTGREYADFSWGLSSVANTMGERNAGQLFGLPAGGVSAAVAVPEPSSLSLLLVGVFGMMGLIGWRGLRGYSPNRQIIC